jgi:hypothetical protein
MKDELLAEVRNIIEDLKRCRYRLSAVSVTGDRESLNSLVAKAYANDSRLIVVLDKAGHDLCSEGGKYPRNLVWFVIAAGGSQDFPKLKELTCPNGGFLVVSKFPLSSEQIQKLKEGVRIAGVRCNF